MSLSDWAKAGWLKAQAPTRDQIAKIFGVVDRDLDVAKRNLSPDGQVNTRPSLGHPEASLGASWPSDRFADRARGIAGRNVASHGEWTRLRFNIAYNAALQLCAIVLLSEGWKPDKLNAHHRTISTLPLILGTERQDDADYLDACRAKRNGLEYDAAGKVSAREARELREFAVGLRETVVTWINEKHPKLFPWKSP